MTADRSVPEQLWCGIVIVVVRPDAICPIIGRRRNEMSEDISPAGGRRRREHAEVEDVMRRTVHVEWRDSSSPSVAVVEAIATATDRDPLALTPIYEYLDTDAFDALVTTARGMDSQISVTFRYEDWTVSVDSTGDIAVIGSER